MADSRAQLIQKIFLAALDVPPGERDAWLGRKCKADDALIAEVRSLLDHAEPTQDPLEKDLDQAIADIPRLDELGEVDETRIQTVHEQPAGINSDDFLTKLSEVGVLSPDEFASVSDSVASGDPTMEPRQLASRLVSEGKLTEYQASALLKGEPELLIDKYLILDLIDVGGMGMVFKAIHRTMNRVVAVKMISRQMLGSVDLVKRFQREVRVAATLEHANIVRAYDADESRGVNFLVMEYVRGDNLSRIVRTSGPLPLDKAVDCIRQTAVGLQHAHERGIVHRDIKPGNLLLSDQGIVKILDLGLAHIDESLAQSSGEDTENDSGRPYISRTELTAAGAILGTASFMAPEQSLDAHLVDFRSDIYSLGCTLYYLLTGDSPYSGSTVFKIFVEHREAEIPSLKEKRPDVPDSIEAVFRRMVAKKPEERFQSITEFLVALDDCRIALPIRDANKGNSVATSAAEKTIEDTKLVDADTDNQPSTAKQPVAKKRMISSRLLWVFSAVAAVALVAINWPDRDSQVMEPSLVDNGDTVASWSTMPMPGTHSVDSGPDDSEGTSVATQSSAADLIASGRWKWRVEKKLPEPINSSAYERGAAMSTDGLTIVFSSNRPGGHGGHDLWMATRTSTESPWSMPVNPGTAINSDVAEIHPVLSTDGQMLMFTRFGDGVRTLVSTRTSLTSPWSPVVPCEINLGHQAAPDLTPDGRTLLVSRRKGLATGEMSTHDLWVGRRSSLQAPWGKFSPVGPPVNTEDHESAGTLSNDGRLLIFQRNLTNNSKQGTSNSKLWMTTRSDWNGTWSDPVPFEDHNGAWDDLQPRLLPDGKSLLFVSNRPGSQLGDIWLAKLVEVETPTPPEESAPVSPTDLLASGEWEWRVEKNLGPTINSRAMVFGADMTADRRTIVFSSLREQQPPGNRDLWIATRSSLEAPWSEPVRLPGEINTVLSEELPDISSDGLSLWFRRDVKSLMHSVRESVDSPWSEAVPDPNLIGNVKNYSMTPNGLTAFRPGKVIEDQTPSQTMGKLTIWRRESRDSPFEDSTDILMPILSPILTSGTMSDDGRMYVFCQEIDNGKKTRQERLFISTRLDTDTAWSAPSLLLDISDDSVSSGSPRLLDDNRSLLFTSTLPGGEGSFDIWLARLVKR